MFQTVSIEQGSAMVYLREGQRIVERADGFYLREGNQQTRVALHVSARERLMTRTPIPIIDAIIELDEPVAVDD